MPPSHVSLSPERQYAPATTHPVVGAVEPVNFLTYFFFFGMAPRPEAM
jgi:hypothetical protein